MMIFKKEKQVVELLKEHVTVTDHCLKAARNALEACFVSEEEATRVAVREVKDLESRADELKREIRDILYSGAFLPQLRAEIFGLVDAIDSIAGQSEEIAKFIDSQGLEFPEEFQAGLMELMSLVLAAFNELERAMKTFVKPKGKFEKLKERSDRVSTLESEADEKEAELMQEVFSSGLEYAHKLHLSGFFSIVSGVADKTEYAADKLVSTALKSAL